MCRLPGPRSLLLQRPLNEALAFEAAFWNEGSRFTSTHQQNVGRGATAPTPRSSSRSQNDSRRARALFKENVARTYSRMLKKMYLAFSKRNISFKTEENETFKSMYLFFLNN